MLWLFLGMVLIIVGIYVYKKVKRNRCEDWEKYIGI